MVSPSRFAKIYQYVLDPYSRGAKTEGKTKNTEAKMLEKKKRWVNCTLARRTSASCAVVSFFPLPPEI